ncbi:hypothetical protein K450DRAFT_248056 [Umbelopsis ramanniana AG]|uniref:Uncharacterized protein n=1 Tax=Umbelopsis ramanniana AG TaxID=1314678 RepID=A0AAD5E7H2_UMBRA|nr:uncharacterized protein K450DRAFT_248056 [Umbelopsis ramanniana AG]KAI8578274.1 hypothetical protein K450DRAFT_248056 [Umbelopsis ramanniana AG]
MSVINWVNTWLTKDGQSDIVSNEISQDEQDGWVHLDVNPHITILEDDSMNPLGESVLNVVSLGDQTLSPSNDNKVTEEVNSVDVIAKAITSDRPVPQIKDEKENEVTRGDGAVKQTAASEQTKLSRQERRQAERKTKKMILKNVKAASSLQKSKTQQNCVSVARSVSMI